MKLLNLKRYDRRIYVVDATGLVVAREDLIRRMTLQRALSPKEEIRCVSEVANELRTVIGSSAGIMPECWN